MQLQTEVCPRCAISLVARGALRRCDQCRGHWVSCEQLREMAAAMATPPHDGKLAFLADPRKRLPCPTCRAQMDPWKVHGVPIDRCARHGVWFDHDELAVVLERVAQPVAPIRRPAGSPRLGNGDHSWVIDVAGCVLHLVIDMILDLM